MAQNNNSIPLFLISNDKDRRSLIPVDDLGRNDQFLSYFSQRGLINDVGYVDVPLWDRRFETHRFLGQTGFEEYLREIDPRVLDKNPGWEEQAYQQFAQSAVAERIKELHFLDELDSTVDETITSKTDTSLRAQAAAYLTQVDMERSVERSIGRSLESAFQESVFPVVREEDAEAIKAFSEKLSKVSQTLVEETAWKVAEEYYKDPDNQTQQRINEILRSATDDAREQLRTSQTLQQELQQIALSTANEWAQQRPANYNRAQEMQTLLTTQAQDVLNRSLAPRAVYDVNTATPSGQPINLSGRFGVSVTQLDGRSEPEVRIYGVETKQEYDQIRFNRIVKNWAMRPDVLEVVDETEVLINTAEDPVLRNERIASEGQYKQTQEAANAWLKLLRGDTSDLSEFFIPGSKELRKQLFLEKSTLQKNTLGMTSEGKIRGRMETYIWNAFAHTVGRHTGLWQAYNELPRAEYNAWTGKGEFSFDLKTGKKKTKEQLIEEGGREVLEFVPWRKLYGILSLRHLGENIASNIEARYITPRVQSLINGKFYQYTANGQRIINLKDIDLNRRYALLDYSSHITDGSALSDLTSRYRQARTEFWQMREASKSNKKLFNPAIKNNFLSLQKQLNTIKSEKNSLVDLQGLVRTLRRRRKDSDEPDLAQPLVSWIFRSFGRLAWTGTRMAFRSANLAMGDPYGRAAARVSEEIASRPRLARNMNSVSTLGRVGSLLLGKNIAAGFALGGAGYLLSGGNPLGAFFGLSPILTPTTLLGLGQGYLAGTMVGKHGALYGLGGYFLFGGGPLGVVAGIMGAGLGRVLQFYQDFGADYKNIAWAEQQLASKTATGFTKFVARSLLGPLNTFKQLMPKTVEGAAQKVSRFKAPFKAPLTAWLVGLVFGWSPGVIAGAVVATWIADLAISQFKGWLLGESIPKWLQKNSVYSVKGFSGRAGLALAGGFGKIFSTAGVFGAIGGFLLGPQFLVSQFGTGIMSNLAGAVIGAVGGTAVWQALRFLSKFVGFAALARWYSITGSLNPLDWFKSADWLHPSRLFGMPNSPLGSWEGFSELYLLYEKAAGLVGTIVGIFKGIQRFFNYRAFVRAEGFNPSWYTGLRGAFAEVIRGFARFGFWDPLIKFLRLRQLFSFLWNTNLPKFIDIYRFLVKGIPAGWRLGIPSFFGSAGQFQIWLRSFGSWFAPRAAAFGASAAGMWTSLGTVIPLATIGTLLAVLVVTVTIVTLLGGAIYLASQPGRLQALAQEGPIKIHITAAPYSCDASITKQPNGKVTGKFTFRLDNTDEFQRVAFLPTVESRFTKNGQSQVLANTELSAANRTKIPIQNLAGQPGYLLEAFRNSSGPSNTTMSFSHEVPDIDISEDATFSEIINLTAIKGKIDTNNNPDTLHLEVVNGKTVIVGGVEKFNVSRSCTFYVGERVEGPPHKLPTTGTVLQGAFNKSRSFGDHRGAELDIADDMGTNVYSTHGGKAYVVASVGDKGQYFGYGLRVIVRGEKYTTYYAHLMRVPRHLWDNRFNGTVVQPGCLIGLMDSTGRSTGSHLHYEMRYTINDPTIPLNDRTFTPDTNDVNDFFSFTGLNRNNYLGTEVNTSGMVENTRNCFPTNNYYP